MSLAGFTLWDVNFRAPKDKAAAKVEEVEECPLDCELSDDDAWEEERLLGDWRLSWRAFASAFS